MTFLNRVDELMAQNGLNKRQLAIKTGIPQTTVYGWYDKGHENITLPTLRKLADYFGCTLEYLVNGDTMTETLPNWHRPLTDAYAAAPELTQRSACNVLEIPHVKPPATPKRRRMVSKITYDSPAAAGQPAYIEDSYERMDFPADEVPHDADYGVRIIGNSMEPDIREGDIVWVASKAEVLDGQVGIFMLHDEAVCKRARYDNFGRLVKLESDNPECDDIDLREYAETDIELRISGRVVGVYHEE